MVTVLQGGHVLEHSSGTLNAGLVRPMHKAIVLRSGLTTKEQRADGQGEVWEPSPEQRGIGVGAAKELVHVPVGHNALEELGIVTRVDGPEHREELQLGDVLGLTGYPQGLAVRSGGHDDVGVRGEEVAITGVEWLEEWVAPAFGAGVADELDVRVPKRLVEAEEHLEVVAHVHGVDGLQLASGQWRVERGLHFRRLQHSQAEGDDGARRAIIALLAGQVVRRAHAHPPRPVVGPADPFHFRVHFDAVHQVVGEVPHDAAVSLGLVHYKHAAASEVSVRPQRVGHGARASLRRLSVVEIVRKPVDEFLRGVTRAPPAVVQGFPRADVPGKLLPFRFHALGQPVAVSHVGCVARWQEATSRVVHFQRPLVRAGKVYLRTDDQIIDRVEKCWFGGRVAL